MSIAPTPLDDLLTSIAARTPTPGGGAVASVVAALGAALGCMVVRFSEGKKTLAAHTALHVVAITRLEAAGRDALALAEADAAAYGRLNALWKLPEDDPARVAGWAEAVAGAIDAPRAVLTLALDVLDLLDQLVGRTSKMLASDLAIAAVLAEAAARSAAWNVRINLPLTDDAATLERETAAAITRASTLCAAIESRIADG